MREIGVFVYIAIEAVIATLGLFFAFEYDKYRKENGADVLWYERLLAQMVFVFLTMTLIYSVLHNRMPMGGDNPVYSSPAHDATCGSVCKLRQQLKQAFPGTFPPSKA